MKKVFLMVAILIAAAGLFGQQNPERFSLTYSGFMTAFDKKIMGSDTIIKVGTESASLIGGEVFLGRRSFQAGFSASYFKGTALVDQYRISELEYFSAGLVFRQSFLSSELKLALTYFRQKFNSEGYFDDRYFADTSLFQGLEISGQFIFTQDNIGAFPKIELWANTKLSLAKDISGQQRLKLRNYYFGLDVQIYRFSIFPNYYLSPMIGLEKPEIMDKCNSIRYRLGIAFGNNVSRSNILKTGVFFSYNNKSYDYTFGNRHYQQKNLVVGGFIAFNPVGFFSHCLR